MGWMRIRDGFVRCERIEAIKHSTYVYDNRYRIIIVTHSGDTLIYHEYDTIEETEEAMHHLIKWIDDKNNE